MVGAPARRWPGFGGPTTSAIRAMPLRDAVRELVWSATGSARRGPDPPAHAPALLRLLLQPGELLLLLRRRRRERRGGRRPRHQHALGGAPLLRDGGRAPPPTAARVALMRARVREAAARLAADGHGPGVRLAPDRARRAAVGAHRGSRRARRARPTFDATSRSRAGRSPRATLRRALVRYPFLTAAHHRAHLRPRAAPEARGASYFPHPKQRSRDDMSSGRPPAAAPRSAEPRTARWLQDPRDRLARRIVLGLLARIAAASSRSWRTGTRMRSASACPGARCGRASRCARRASTGALLRRQRRAVRVLHGRAVGLR